MSQIDPIADLAKNWHRHAMIDNWLTIVRSLLVCLTACCAAFTSAVACTGTRDPASFRGILLEHVPADIDAPVVVEVTIYDATDNVAFAYERTFVPATLMRARVDRVIKGSIDTKYLKIFAYMGACSHVGVGRGIVLGTLRDDPQRGIMLQAVQRADTRGWSKEFFAEQNAIQDATKCFKNDLGAPECRLPGIGLESN